jgi:protein-disulfide isomerase
MEQNLNLNNANQWALISFALIGFIAGYAANEVVSQTIAGPGARVAAPAPTAAAPQPSVIPVAEAADADDDAFLGKENAPVTLIEFTDYQCPFCKRHVDQSYQQIIDNYVKTGKIKYVVRDFPLSIHPNAPKASEATECAEDGGKFWEMHDLLFEKQNEWSRAPDAPTVFKGYASDLGLSSGTFGDCLDSGKYTAEVQKDFADGSAAGITGTPGFILLDKNGKGQKISGAQPYSSFAALIDAAL